MRFRTIQHSLRSCENCIKDVIYNRRHDAKARRLGSVFKALSFPFYGAVCLRQEAYRRRLLRGQHLGCMVIVVGNLAVGGTGKTPIVEKLAKALQARGRKVAILSRGYKSKKECILKKLWHWILHSEPHPPKVVSDGKQCLLPYEIAGDEPLLLARNLPKTCVVVDKDRVKAGKFAIRNLNCDTLILDDGYQYFQLKGTFYILLIDTTNPFGNGSVLPRGILREPLSHMQRAQFILLTKVDQIPTERVHALKRFVRRYNKQAPILSCIHAPKYLQAISNGEQAPLSLLRGHKIAALSGIASPKSFEKFLEDSGANLIYKEHFLDHHRYSEADLNEVFENAKRMNVEYVITTEKDAVRISKHKTFDIPFYFLRMEIEWVEGSKTFDNMLRTLANELP